MHPHELFTLCIENTVKSLQKIPRRGLAQKITERIWKWIIVIIFLRT